MAQRIVVADADPMVARVMRFMLEDAGYIAEIARTGVDVVVAVAGRETALVLLEWLLPDIRGPRLVRELRARGYRGPLVVVSGSTSIEDKLAAFDLGIDDYIAKPFEPLELLARTEAVLRRAVRSERATAGAVVRAGDAALDLGALTYRSNEVSPVLLAPTEMRILELLMRDPDVAISRATIIARVWGDYDLAGDTNRVDVYIRRIRRKIEPDPAQPRYLRTVHGLGYAFQAHVRSDALGAEDTPTVDDPNADYVALS